MMAQNDRSSSVVSNREASDSHSSRGPSPTGLRSYSRRSRRAGQGPPPRPLRWREPDAGTGPRAGDDDMRFVRLDSPLWFMRTFFKGEDVTNWRGFINLLPWGCLFLF